MMRRERYRVKALDAFDNFYSSIQGKSSFFFSLASKLHFEMILSISAICYAAFRVFVFVLVIDFQYGGFQLFFKVRQDAFVVTV